MSRSIAYSTDFDRGRPVRMRYAIGEVAQRAEHVPLVEGGGLGAHGAEYPLTSPKPPPPPSPPREGEGCDGTARSMVKSGAPPPCGEGLGGGGRCRFTSARRGPGAGSMREANDRGYECPLVEDATESYFPQFKAATIDMIVAQGGIVGWVTPLKELEAAFG